MLWYNHLCLLIWTVFSGERCGPWASCLLLMFFSLKVKILSKFSCIPLYRVKRSFIFIHVQIACVYEFSIMLDCLANSNPVTVDALVLIIVLICTLRLKSRNEQQIKNVDIYFQNWEKDKNVQSTVVNYFWNNLWSNEMSFMFLKFRKSPIMRYIAGIDICIKTFHL